MSYAFLGDIRPYEAGYLKEIIDPGNIEKEIDTICREMADLSIDSL